VPLLTGPARRDRAFRPGYAVPPCTRVHVPVVVASPAATRRVHVPGMGDLMYSLAQAARAAGKSKPTIARAIKAGKISAARGDDGSYQVDESELARVYPLAGHVTGSVKRSEPGNGAGYTPTVTPGEMEALRLLLAEREESLRDLRRRLDAETEERRREAEERRRLQERLVALLERRPAGSVPAVVPQARRRRWWRW
jgi:hypothetical protein